MNSNASKTFSPVKGRKRIRETLNSVTSRSIGREEPITLPERSEKVKFVTEVRQYYARRGARGSDSRVDVHRGVEFRNEISGSRTFDLSSNVYFNFV